MTRAIGLCACVLASAVIAFGTMARAETLAGSLKETQGKVLVNAGNGYELAQPGMLLKLGDRVLTLQGASTVVAQVDGCVTRLAENTAFTLQEPSLCNGGVNTLRQIGPYYAQAIGAPQPGEIVTDGVSAAAAEPTEEPYDPDYKPKKKKKAGFWTALAVGVLLAADSGGSSSSSAVTH